MRLTLASDEASLTEAEIDAAVQAVVTQLVARTGGACAFDAQGMPQND